MFFSGNLREIIGNFIVVSALEFMAKYTKKIQNTVAYQSKELPTKNS